MSKTPNYDLFVTDDAGLIQGLARTEWRPSPIPIW